MPPKRSQKNDERQKKILSAKERILAKKRFLLKIVEKMIEDDVSKEWFLSNCTYLCQSDFNDVVQERSIGSLCGYPLCSSPMKQTLRQKYHISQVTNKVYDLTERKCFCSNHCYKASNYIKAQLSSIPLYMRKEEKIIVNLLSDCDNRGSVGEEIEFHHKINKDEIHKVYSEETNNNLQNLLNEQVKKCADSLSGLQIKEHLFEKQYVFSDETPNKSDKSALKDGSYPEVEFDSDDSVDEKLFPSYDNVPVLSNKQMPIPEKSKKSVLIPPQKPEIKSIIQTNDLSLHFVHEVFKDWMTEGTLKYLMGEKYIYGVKADQLFKTMTESTFPCSEKLASIKNEYIKLCLKIDSLPDDDDIIDSAELDIVTESQSKPNSKVTENENNSGKRVFKRRPKKSKEKNKHVTFAPDNKITESEQKNALTETKKVKVSFEERVTERIEEKSEKDDQLFSQKKDQLHINKSTSLNPDENLLPKEAIIHKVEQTAQGSIEILNDNQYSSKENEGVLQNNIGAEEGSPVELPEPTPQPSFPLVDSDSVSQNILRKQVLSKNLKSVYTELLPIAELHYTHIRDHVRKFVDSLSLTSTNIIYKPKEWKVISLVLFRMLTRTVLKDLHDDLQFVKLCEAPLIPITLDPRDVENLVCELVSAENIIST